MVVPVNGGRWLRTVGKLDVHRTRWFRSQCGSQLSLRGPIDIAQAINTDV